MTLVAFIGAVCGFFCFLVVYSCLCVGSDADDAMEEAMKRRVNSGYRWRSWHRTNSRRPSNRMSED